MTMNMLRVALRHQRCSVNLNWKSGRFCGSGGRKEQGRSDDDASPMGVRGLHTGRWEIRSPTNRTHTVSKRWMHSEQNATFNVKDVTFNGLSVYDMPLGTMTDKEWGDMFTAMRYWCETKMHPKGNPSALAHSILQRLVYEYSATASHETKVALLRTRYHEIIDAHQMVLDSWKEVISHHPKSYIAYERGQEVLLGFMEWTDMDISSNATDENFPATDLDFLIRGWLNLESEEGLDRALGLVMTCTNKRWRRMIPLESVELLFPCIQDTNDRLLSSGHENSSQQLVKRLKELRNIPGWEGSPNLDAVGIDVQQFDDVDSHAEPPTTAPEFEVKALQKRMIDKVQKATKDDIDEIMSLSQTVQSYAKDSYTMNPNLYQELIEYFIRAKNPEQATLWLELFAVILRPDPPSQHILSSDKFSSVMELWIENDENLEIAPWRVDELFRRAIQLEADEQFPDFCLEKSTYEAYIRAWSGSNDPTANRKLQDCYAHMKMKNIRNP